MRRVIITSALVTTLLIVLTAFAIFYARGYQIFPGNRDNMVEGTGLLVLTSKPDAAKVYINNHLTTATNNTINLSPGDYEVKIIKDGYFSWQKNISVKKEIVSRADATLFPITPKLESITITGASNPVVDPTGSLLAYTIASISAQKNGVYILDMNSKTIFNLGGGITQIANDSLDKFSNSTLQFSPDGAQLSASISGTFGDNNYLLTTSGLNTNPQDVTAILPQVEANWNALETQIINKLTTDLGKKLAKVATVNFKNISFSPDQEKIIYEASTSAELPIIIQPRLIGANSTPEIRNIKEGNTYVYDIKEDKNYLIYDKSSHSKNSAPKFVWHTDSNHLIYIKDKTIRIMEYDAQNDTLIFAGPFWDNFVYPWPDGSSIVILTNLNNPDIPYNLYRLGLK